MTESAKTPDPASSPRPGKPVRAVPPVPPPPSAPPRSRPAVPDGASAEQAGAAGKEARERPDPTRFGDWEKNGRCIDF